MTSRAMEIVQYEHNPTTGESLHFSESNIRTGLQHKSIRRWAYIRHDRDAYTPEDEARNPKHRAGLPKPPHWHVVLDFGNKAQDLDTVAKWFGVPPQQVEKAKGGSRAFLDKVKYLTHESEKEQQKGKYHYPDEVVRANFAWREALDERDKTREKYGGDVTPKEQQRLDVLLYGKTLRQCMQSDPLIYAEDMEKLRKLRGEYLASRPMPKERVNIYVEGDGGSGKGAVSRALSAGLFPTAESPYFELGGEGVNFEGYDGQPCIIWHDRRAAALLKELGGRGNVFNVFDPHPPAIWQNIKFASVTLVNTVNIVNSIEPHGHFLDGLAGEYTDRMGQKFESEDKGQSYRRFPIILSLRAHDFDILVNTGYIGESDDLCCFQLYRRVFGNFGFVERCLTGAARDAAMRSLLEPILSAIHMVQEQTNASKPAAAPNLFALYGTTLPEDNRYSGDFPYQTAGWYYHRIFGTGHYLTLSDIPDSNIRKTVEEMHEDYIKGLCS